MRFVTAFKATCLAMVYFTVAQFPCTAAPAYVDEGKLRAAVIVGILRFTDWPANALMNDTINICFSNDSVTSIAMAGVAGRKLIGDKTIRSTITKSGLDFSGDCDVIVLEKTADTSGVSQITELAHRNNILTVCNECEREEIVLINLVRNNDRIGFVIDLGTARKTGFFFSSSLLELAVKVKQ